MFFAAKTRATCGLQNLQNGELETEVGKHYFSWCLLGFVLRELWRYSPCDKKSYGSDPLNKQPSPVRRFCFLKPETDLNLVGSNMKLGRQKRVCFLRFMRFRSMKMWAPIAPGKGNQPPALSYEHPEIIDSSRFAQTTWPISVLPFVSDLLFPSKSHSRWTMLIRNAEARHSLVGPVLPSYALRQRRDSTWIAFVSRPKSSFSFLSQVQRAWSRFHNRTSISIFARKTSNSYIVIWIYTCACKLHADVMHFRTKPVMPKEAESRTLETSIGVLL